MAIAAGIMLPILRGVPATELVDVAKLAEEAGLGGLGCGEHAAYEAFATLGAMAAATRTLSLETAIVSPLSRSAALTAMGAATLADLSGGRFMLGLGSGSPIIAGWHQSDFEKPLTRMRRFLTTVRQILNGEKSTAAGGFRLLRPPEKPVRIFLGAANPKMLALAAELADGVILNFVGAGQIANVVAQLQRIRAEYGNERPLEVLAFQWAWPDDDEETGRLAFAAELGPYLAVPTYAHAVGEIIGARQVETIAEAWRTGGRRAAAGKIPPTLASELMASGASAIRKRTGELERAGCTAVRYLPVTPQSGDSRQIRALISILRNNSTKSA